MSQTETTAPGVQAWETIGENLAHREAERRAVMRTMRFDTIAVHGIYDAQAALANQGSVNEPLFLSPAQHFVESDQMECALAYRMPSWTYTRIANPTVHYLEETLALLETYGSDIEASACGTASGMAAVFMATEPFLARDDSLPPPNVVASAKCYGGTFMLFSERYGRERGVQVRWVCDPLDLDEWASNIDEGTRFVYGEMPSNPSLAVFDIPAVAELAHAAGIPLIVDPTVATPALLRPLAMGADVSVHSLSKSLAGSGMAIGGALIARRAIRSRVGPDEMRADFATYVKLWSFRDHGPAMSPFNALMTLADVRTIRSRIDAWSRGAMTVASFLETHPKVDAVRYPGLASFPGHGIARRDLWLADGDEHGTPVNRYGPLLSFDVRGGGSAVREVFDRLDLILRATDLGRIKSVATIPAISTHQQQGEEGRELAGVPSNQIRLSIGGEDPVDLIADLERALG
ncbi:MAG TPA: PLP-dependent transferase [Actinomycetota bacterium]|nr:PLP-dependent transferase [Actinomycetota bacterium]